MIRVGVIRGGVSHQYDQSLETGATVLQILRDYFPGSYKAVDILVTKDGTWHIAGRPVDSAQLKDSVDIVWNALHGAYGEDGALQASLEALQIPHTGSSPFATALSSNRAVLKAKAKERGLKTRAEYVIRDYRYVSDTVLEVYLKEQAQEIFLKFPGPWHVMNGSFTSVARTRSELLDALRTASEKPGDILIEEYIEGKEASVLVADGFRNQNVYTFMPVGIKNHKGASHSYSDTFSTTESQSLQDHTRSLYQDLGLKHLAEARFTITPRHTYISSISTAPAMAPHAPLQAAVSKIGSTISEFVDHILNQGLGKNVKE